VTGRVRPRNFEYYNTRDPFTPSQKVVAKLRGQVQNRQAQIDAINEMLNEL